MPRVITTTQYLQVPDNLGENLVGNFGTVCCWWKPGATGAGALLGKIRQVPNFFQYLLEQRAAGNYRWVIGNGGVGSTEVQGGAWVVGQWQHVLGLRNASVQQIWVDGKLAGSVAASTVFTSTTQLLHLGRWSDGTNPATGEIREVGVWSDALEPDEVVRLSQGVPVGQIRVGALQVGLPLRGNGAGGGPESNLSAKSSRPSIVGAAAPGSPMDVQVSSFAFFLAAEIQEDEIQPPFATIDVDPFAPDLVGPEELDAPFATIDVDPFAPQAAGSINPPFYTIDFQPGTVFLSEDGLPPFVPPSLPPTIPPGTPVGPGVPLPPLSSGGLAGIRFYQGPPWRWVVTDLDTRTLTFLDRLSFESKVTYILNRASTLSLFAPSDNPEVNILDDDGFPFVDEGDRLVYGFRREGTDPRWVCRAAGTILQTEDTGLVEDARTFLTAEDPWRLAYSRPMVDILGEFAEDAGFFSFDDTQWGVIILTFLRNTILNHGTLRIDVPTTEWLINHGVVVEDPLDQSLGDMPGSGFYTGTIDTTTQVDVNFQQGMMLGEVWDQCIQSGALDVWLEPIYDPINRPGYTHQIHIYDRMGRQATDAVMAWDKPGRNLVRFNHVKDGYKRANTVRYYYSQGGPVIGTIPISSSSVTRYGEYWAQQYFPGRIEAAALAFAELQLTLRENGIDTVEIEPTPERAPFLFTEWFLGDTVPVYASNKARAAVAGFQRIYGIELNIDENSYERIARVLGSPEA